MKKLIPIISYLIYLSNISCLAQDQIQIHIPTVEEESQYVWRTLQDILFFEENNYQVGLPSGDLIEALKEKSRSRILQDADYAALKAFMQTEVYNKSDYQKGYQKIKENKEFIQSLLNRWLKFPKNWKFKEFKTYHINLTLYGPGGSYNPDEGSMLIYTTPQGQFKNYKNPSNTLVHEIVHLGIEETIIQKFQVPHRLKERIVDKIVSLYFQEDLMNYQVQDMGEYRIDTYLQKKEDIKNLSQFVKEIMDSK